MPFQSLFKYLKGLKMSPKQRKFRANLIKIIHILKNDKAMDDEMYQAILSERYGVDSSALLSIDELKDFALVLGYKGYKTKDSSLNRLIEVHFNCVCKGTSSKTQIATIVKMWQSKEAVRNKDIISLLSFIKRIINRTIFALGVLDKDEASKVIIAIKSIK